MNNVAKPCTESMKTVVFSNMTMANYTYNVTILNAVDEVTRNGGEFDCSTYRIPYGWK